MRRVLLALTGGVTAIALAIPAYTAQAQSRAPAETGETREYVVLYKEGAPLKQARADIKAAGGTIVTENTAVGVATVRTANVRFVTDAGRRAALAGAAANRTIGHAPRAAQVTRKRQTVEKEGRGTHGRLPGLPGKGEEPLAPLQWNMRQIGATTTGSYRVEPGDRRVLVGVLDTGIDASHPDIAPNFNRALSRNFTTDIPVDANGATVDGPCETPNCVDPPDVDESDHGTHVAATIAAPRNGLGIAGVAPNVSLVNLRAGQDSGYFFLQPSIDALTYAGDHGIDVVNMSYYIDPWLFNCTANPADSPADQAEQRVIIQAAQRALDYARGRGVTLIAAAGNEATDYTKPYTDTSSPDFASEPGEAPRSRQVTPSCFSMPSEGKGVIPVSATGISGRKAYYSSFGKGYVSVAAPGGDKYDTPDNRADDARGIWAAYPERLARARGELNADGTPKVSYVVRSCKGTTCAYYQSLQGTSMAAPHAAGVAALIVSRYGRPSKDGLSLDPRLTEAILRGTAASRPCPPGGNYTYTRQVKQADGSYQTVTTTHTCEGPRVGNGFYGNGIINALAAVHAARH
ncbi:peptidase S8 [Actinomadura craniellae]|uniref:Peptidase S8 n=1 Tax=Actinomadura craniellae TaxID=2231787 RepID=A0A365GYJ8_9ACTN|nr:S8 family serine peptidase [Actinomadura craniellae]RAY11003.1 peptidase S8 [Actinomadura craniellae]